MFEQFLIRFIFLSMAFHSPNVPGNSFDWALSAGTKGDQSHYEVMSERQNNEKFYGLDLYQGVGFAQTFTEVKIFKRTSRGIDTQKFSESFPRYGFLRLGSVATFDRWNNHEQRVLVSYNRGGFRGSIEARKINEIDAVDLQYTKILMEKDFEKFSTQVEPKITYKREKEKEYWSLDLRLLFGVGKKDDTGN